MTTNGVRFLFVLLWRAVWGLPVCSGNPAWAEDAPGPAFKVGAAAVELEADDAMVIGGDLEPVRTEQQEGKLRAMATVIEGMSGERFAIVACDVLMIRRDYLDEAARRVEAEAGIPFDAVLMNATHTHHAPSTATIHGYERTEVFCTRVEDGIIAAVRAAAARLKQPEQSRAEMVFWLGEEFKVKPNSKYRLKQIGSLTPNLLDPPWFGI